jgi:TusA-related sulfurtransferase
MNQTPESLLVDARGLSCPQPAILTRQAISQAAGRVLEILVDAIAQRDNVIRVAVKEGWSAVPEETADGRIRIRLTK